VGEEAASVGVGGYWSGANLYVHAAHMLWAGLWYLGVSDTPSGGYYWSGSLCRIVDMDFREFPFHALR
jgi:hypothetical protein